MTARAVAVEAGERDVIARIGEDREYGIGGNAECPGVGTVAAQAVRHTLVRARRGVLRVVAGRCVALRARRGGRNVIRGLGRLSDVRSEGRRRGVTAAALAGRGMRLVEGLRTRFAAGGRAARHHPEARSGLVTAAAPAD